MGFMLQILLWAALCSVLCSISGYLHSKVISHCRWGGPLSQNWLNIQLALQKQILSRMQELGMTPGMALFWFQRTFSSILPSLCPISDWQTMASISLMVQLSKRCFCSLLLQCIMLLLKLILLVFIFSSMPASASIILWKCSSCIKKDIPVCKYYEAWRLVC